MPVETFPPTLYILGTDQDIGKTAASMGIISKMLTAGFGCEPDQIGYIKPVGQQTVLIDSPEEGPIKVDKDVQLITEFYGLKGRPYRAMSPVVWTAGTTAEFIDAASRGDPDVESERLRQRIRDAYRVVAAGRKVVVCEGTGQPGVGSVAGVSNGDVIKLLKASGVYVVTILITRGGIGSTIDGLFPHLLSLNCMDCEVDGLIINAVRQDKMDKVRDYLQRYYAQIFPALYCCLTKIVLPPPILGMIPEVPELGMPTMRLLAETFRTGAGSAEFLTPEHAIGDPNQFVRGLKVRSLEVGFEAYLEDGDVFVVGINANEAIRALLRQNEHMKRLGKPGLTGLILSCSATGGLHDETLQAIRASGIPSLTLPQDSAEIVRDVAELSVKIQPYDLAKKILIDQTYEGYLDLSELTDRFGCR